MVMYIEACESGSMMTDLPEDIDGELNLNLSRPDPSPLPPPLGAARWLVSSPLGLHPVVGCLWAESIHELKKKKIKSILINESTVKQGNRWFLCLFFLHVSTYH